MFRKNEAAHALIMIPLYSMLLLMSIPLMLHTPPDLSLKLLLYVEIVFGADIGLIILNAIIITAARRYT
jgi:hypothetical protein